MAVVPQKYILEQNFQLPTPPKVWVSGFLSVDGNTKLVSAITENGKKMAVAPQKCILEQNFQLPTPLKFGSPVFWVSDRNTKLVSAIMENGKNGRSSPKTHPRAKLPITDPP